MDVKSGATAPPPLSRIGPEPNRLFRFLSRERDADALAAGKVYLSTLERCRTHENVAARDPRDATLDLQVEDLVIDSGDPRVTEFSRLTPFRFERGVTDFRMSGFTVVTMHPDAWVLCTTMRDTRSEKLDKFGAFCVEITHVWTFFSEITRALHRQCPLAAATVGPVTYAPLETKNFDPRPGPLAFVKQPDPYADESEFRGIWLPAAGAAVKPVEIELSAVADFVRRIR